MTPPRRSTVQVIIPTAGNLLSAIVARLITSQRSGTTADVTIPKLRDRARFAVNESSVISFVDFPPPDGEK